MEAIERELREAMIRAAAPRVFRDRLNPLDCLDDHSFRQRFRLSRRGFSHVLHLIADDLSPETARSAPLTAAQKLAIFLETIGSSSNQRITALTFGCSQATVSRVISEVSDMFYSRRSDFIKWPTEEERNDIALRFYSLCGIPNVVGALDGTHIKIMAPTESKDSYVNRKSYHSINMGAIADIDLKFIWVSANFPGRADDSKVFRSSALYRDLCSGRKEGTLLADNAYRSENFLLKPILGESRTESETRYTMAVCKGRVVVEHAFGALKRQFISLQTELRHSPARSAKIIVAACCLRNLCIATKEDMFRPTEQTMTTCDEPNEAEATYEQTEDNSLRSFIVHRYFDD